MSSSQLWLFFINLITSNKKRLKKMFEKHKQVFKCYNNYNIIFLKQLLFERINAWIFEDISTINLQFEILTISDTRWNIIIVVDHDL